MKFIQPKKYLVQAKDLGGFKDVHEFDRKRDAKLFIRGQVKDWAESEGDFRIVTVRVARRR